MPPKNAIGNRFFPSSFDLTQPFALHPITSGEKWESLTSHIRKLHPPAVLGYCPPLLQLDTRIYEIVRALRVPYLSTRPHNPALAVELIRQMRVTLVVATREEALELEEALQRSGAEMPAWHVILSPFERDARLPSSERVFADIHESPGMPYGA